MTEPMTNEERIAALEAEIAKLKAAAEPKPAFKPVPHQSYDYTANASMSPRTMAELAAAVGTGLVREVVGDFRGGPALPKSQAEGAKSTGSRGWVEPRPLEPPPGIELMDQGLDQQDALDKLARARRLAGDSE